jgi:hypothetical protein
VARVNAAGWSDRVEARRFCDVDRLVRPDGY